MELSKRTRVVIWERGVDIRSRAYACSASSTMDLPLIETNEKQLSLRRVPIALKLSVDFSKGKEKETEKGEEKEPTGNRSYPYPLGKINSQPAIFNVFELLFYDAVPSLPTITPIFRFNISVKKGHNYFSYNIHFKWYHPSVNVKSD